MNQNAKECNRCKIPLGPNYEDIYCPDCQASSRRHNKNRRERMRSAGQCMDCHKEREPECQGYLRCKDCLERRKQANKARRETAKAITATTEKIVDRIIQAEPDEDDNVELLKFCLECDAPINLDKELGFLCKTCLKPFTEKPMTNREIILTRKLWNALYKAKYPNGVRVKE